MQKATTWQSSNVAPRKIDAGLLRYARNDEVKCLLALFLGGLLVLAFSPFNQGWLALTVPAVLLWLYHDTSPQKASWIGLLFGLGFIGGGCYWLFISIHEFGHVPLMPAALLTVLFVGFYASFFALQGYLLQRFCHSVKPIYYALLFVSSFFVIEWLRAHLFTGFPWLLLGYSQVAGPLKGFISLVGANLTSLVVLIVSASLWLGTLSRRYFIAAVVIVITALLLPLPQTQSLPRISIVQGNIPQAQQFRPQFLRDSLVRYTELSQPLWQNSDLIIWPESAIPATATTVPHWLAELAKLAKQHDVALLVGMPEQANKDHYYNTVRNIGRGEAYAKQHLVPFGEFIPGESWLGTWFERLNIPMASFVPGRGQAPLLHWHQWKIAVLICYEIAFDQLISQAKSADLVVVASNDGWFGHSIAAAQHRQIAQARALELGKPVIFASNNGPSAIIGADGKIIKGLTSFKTASLSTNT